MALAIIADALQIIVFPLFVQGGASPADDILDLGIGVVLIQLLGWHWEFLPSFFRQARAGSRSGSFLDDGSCQRVSKIEADTDHHRGQPRKYPAVTASRPQDLHA